MTRPFLRRPLLPLLAILVAAAPAGQVEISPAAIISGNVPGIVVRGLPPGAIVRLHALRPFERWEKNDKGEWAPIWTTYRSWVEVRADATGTIALDRAVAGAGTYRGTDGYGLLWSMRKPTDQALARSGLPKLEPRRYRGGETRFVVTRDGAVIADTMVASIEPPGLTVETVADGALNGVFAAPVGGRRLPTVILLHGSEGGGADSARALAVRFAGQGYAAFALNYFAWDMKGLKDVPNIHVNQPIELIDRTRRWLIARREVASDRIGLYGHSKGAEYAEVAAVRYRWIKAVAACVPTDAVWEGYGIGDERAKQPADFVAPRAVSSWSWHGVPLPYIPLKPWSDDPDRGYFDNAGRYEMGRRANPAEAASAVIPIERAAARFLLLGSDRDETWASGAMARRLAARMAAAGRGDRVRLRVYPTAGHQICGDGTYPSFIWADPSLDPRIKDPMAEGEAAVDAWLAIRAFFKRSL